MTQYWVIVRRDKVDLLELLRAAFHGRKNFIVVADRRVAASVRYADDRRATADEWDGHDFFVVERVE